MKECFTKDTTVSYCSQSYSHGTKIVMEVHYTDTEGSLTHSPPYEDCMVQEIGYRSTRLKTSLQIEVQLGLGLKGQTNAGLSSLVNPVDPVCHKC